MERPIPGSDEAGDATLTVTLVELPYTLTVIAAAWAVITFASVYLLDGWAIPVILTLGYLGAAGLLWYALGPGTLRLTGIDLGLCSPSTSASLHLPDLTCAETVSVPYRRHDLVLHGRDGQQVVIEGGAVGTEPLRMALGQRLRSLRLTDKVVDDRTLRLLGLDGPPLDQPWEPSPTGLRPSDAPTRSWAAKTGRVGSRRSTSGGHSPALCT